MSKDPSMPFYVNDWLSSPTVMCMSLAEQGAFVRLLCLCWASQEASIPGDESRLAAMSGMGEGWFTNGSRLVRDCFIDHPTIAGMLTNKRLYELWQERVKWKKKSSDAGRKSGETRRKSNKQQGKGNEPTFENGSHLVHGLVRTKCEPNANSSSSSLSSLNTAARAPENSRGLIPGDYMTFQQGLTDACEQWLNLFPAPKRTGPVECARLFPHEVQRIQIKLGNCDEPTAIKHLMQRTRMYVGSWKGKSAKYGYSSETFLRNGCCDEPVEAWEERLDEPKTRKGSRASADAEAMKLLARTGLAEELMKEMNANGRK